MHREELIDRWGETGVPRENHLTHPQAELGLSHMWYILASVLTIQKDTCQYGSSAYIYMPVWHQLRQILASVVSVTLLTYKCQCGNSIDI